MNREKTAGSVRLSADAFLPQRLAFLVEKVQNTENLFLFFHFVIFLAKNKLEIGGEVLYIYIDIQNGGSAEEKAKAAPAPKKAPGAPTKAARKAPSARKPPSR